MNVFNTSASRGENLRQSGFNLLELIIATVLTMLISAMMFRVFNDQERAAGKNEDSSHRQDELRFSLQALTRQTRMMGYGVGFRMAGSPLDGQYTMLTCDGCGEYDSDGDGVPEAGAATNTGGSDQLWFIYRNPGQEFLLDFETYQAVAGPCNLSVLATKVSEPLNPSNILSYGRSPKDLAQGDIISCYDESSSLRDVGLMWTVQDDVNVAAAIAVNVVANSTDPDVGFFGNVCPSDGNIPYRMTCGAIKGSTIGFYLQDSVLWMDDDGSALNSPFFLSNAGAAITDDIPIARNVEDFQLAFCLPSEGVTAAIDETVLFTNTQDCLNNPASPFWVDPSAMTIARDDETTSEVESDLRYVRAVRLSLVVQGDLTPTEQSIVSMRPDLENHTGLTNTDASNKYPRSIQSVVVQLPNYRYTHGLAAQ